MKNASNRRQRQRVTPPEVLPAWMGLRRDLRVINLSAEGAMIEHAERLSPGQTCVLGLRLAGVDLPLHARVVWSQVHGTGSGPSGQREIHFRSGLHFPDLPAGTATYIRQYLATLNGRKADTTHPLDDPADVSRAFRPPSPTPPGTLGLDPRGGFEGEVPNRGHGQPKEAGSAARSVPTGNQRLPSPPAWTMGNRLSN